jgi:ABC-type antimicrobial peptide transport system permease subunit
VLGSLAIVAGLGLLTGAIPCLRAMRMSPIEALRRG